MNYREKRQYASEESFARGGERDDDIHADNVSKIKARFVVPKTEFSETETKIVMIGERFYEFKNKELRLISTVKLQLQNIEEGQDSNVFYNNGNEAILDKEVSVTEDYVTVHEDIKNVDKTKEYFVDFKEGQAIFYKIDSNDNRIKIKGLVNTPKLITVEKKEKDNEDKYIVKSSDLPAPTKTFIKPVVQRLSEEGKVLYTSHGEVDKKPVSDKLKENKEVVSTDLKEIKTENLFESGDL